MVTLAVALAATLTAATYVEDPEGWDRLRPEIVRSVENAIVMPSGAEDIDRYDRFYSVEWRGDRPVVVGAFLERRPEQAEGENYRLYGPLPFDIEGGGCSVVNLTYDLENDESPRLNCNGDGGPERFVQKKRLRPIEAQIVNIPKR